MRISELEEDIFTRAIPLGTDTVSLTTLDSAVEWYTACSSHHDRCNLPFNEHRAGRRLDLLILVVREMTYRSSTLRLYPVDQFDT